VIAARHSAWLSVIAPATVIGAMAPISVKGVTMLSCPCRAKSISPCAIGMSSVRGLLVLMIV
jgi:hypothetical protein